MKHSVVVVGGGSGTRMQSDIPKQFIRIAGKPLIVWSLQKFTAFDPEIEAVLVIPPGQLHFWQEITQDFPQLGRVKIAEGGQSRFDSVYNGLQQVYPENLVGIHDAVRPLVSTATIKRCFETAAVKGNAIPAIDSEDTLRMVSEEGIRLLNREEVKRIQTPQVFHASDILSAYKNATGQSFTDDASVFEANGGKIHLVPGNKENIKITYPSDIDYASMILEA